ncbi:MAG TPA: rhodanese-like domain-containing protein [Candidatus Baltobacteraceae bacterium]|nr:rhodanese-like domain-containing protein [Candidatus Baltobacteraceae bacterium]
MTVDELHSLGENGATILNVGKHAGHEEIRGAVRYRPHDLLVAERLVLPLAPDKPVVLYDERGGESDTERIAEKLRAEGFRVEVLDGGFAAWSDANGPTQQPSMDQVVPPSRAGEAGKLDDRI